MEHLTMPDTSLEMLSRSSQWFFSTKTKRVKLLPYSGVKLQPFEGQSWLATKLTFGFSLAKETLGHLCEKPLGRAGWVELWHCHTAAGRQFIRGESLRRKKKKSLGQGNCKVGNSRTQLIALNTAILSSHSLVLFLVWLFRKYTLYPRLSPPIVPKFHLKMKHNAIGMSFKIQVQIKALEGAQNIIQWVKSFGNWCCKVTPNSRAWATYLGEELVVQDLVQCEAVTGVLLQNARDELLSRRRQGRGQVVFHFLDTLVCLLQIKGFKGRVPAHQRVPG